MQVVPYNLHLAMFSLAIVNVLCFDPDLEQKQHTHTHTHTNIGHQTVTQKPARAQTQNHGAEQARGYAGKYCAKPEASYPAVASCVRLPCVTHVYPHASCFLAVVNQEALL